MCNKFIIMYNVLLCVSFSYHAFSDSVIFRLLLTVCIMNTCPWTVYIEKVGFAGVYLVSLSFLIQNIDCGYALESPRRGGSNVYPQSMF